MKKREKVSHLIPPGGTFFTVRILNCQQNNWKGEIKWLDGKETIHFRSLLELLMLIQGALEMQDLHREEDYFRSWREAAEVIEAEENR